MEIQNFYNKADIDSVSGKMTLGNDDGTNIGSIDLVKRVDLHSDISFKPDIYTSSEDAKSARNGSYLFENGKSFIKKYDKWRMIHTNEYDNIQDALEIEYYNSSSQIVEGDIRSFMRKIYRAKIDSPLEIGYLLSGSNETIVGEPDVTITGVTGIFSDNGIVYLKAASSIFAIEDGDTELIMSNYQSPSHKIRMVSETLVEIIDGKIVLGSGEFTYDTENVLDVIGLDGKLVAIKSDKIEIYDLFTMDIEMEVYTDAYSAECSISSIDNDTIVYAYNQSMRTINVLTGVNTTMQMDNQNNYIDMAIDSYGIVWYIDSRDNMVHKRQLITSDWEKISVDLMFKRTMCPSVYQVDNWYTNIVENGESEYLSKYGIGMVNSFSIMGNRSLFALHGSRVTKIDISDGVFEDKIVETLNTGMVVARGCVSFNDMIYVSNGELEIIEISESMDIIRTIDLSGLIAGESIIDMCELSGTLYIYTTNRKIYSMNSVDGAIINVVQLELGTSESSICVVDSDMVFITDGYSGARQIFALSLEDGLKVDVTPLSGDPSTMMLTSNFRNLYSLDRSSPSRLIRYRREPRFKTI